MFSFVFPMDTNRLEQFKVTKKLYDEMPFEMEFNIPTREKEAVAQLSLIHISEPTRRLRGSRMPSSA